MKPIKGEIITIGDEILYGQILDTNTQWISIELDKIGVRIVRKTTVGDEETEILKVFAEAEERADIILITGGLGPTNDDLTKPALSRYFNSPLQINDQALKELMLYFTSRGRNLNELNRQQAALPECCSMISNKLGTAPGMWFEKSNKIFVSMPGVPHEMKAMMESSILPLIKSHFSLPVIFHKMIKTVGIGESWLAELIQSWEANLPSHIKLAYLPSVGHTKLRLTAQGDSLDPLQRDVEEQIQLLLPIAGKYIYGYDQTTLEEAVGELLKKEHKTIATAESCTGGAIAKKITSVSGSSEYFRGGVIPYHNDVKEDVLGVKMSTLMDHGAVSEATVKEMAINVRGMLKADIGVASSGIAGPTGGTPDKPVGTVWIAYSDKETTIAKKLMLGTDRKVNIELAIIAVLNLIRLQVSKILINEN